MKLKSLILAAALTLACAFGATAQTTNLPVLPVKGTIDIKYNSRNTPGVKGVKDVYTIDVTVAGSAKFNGTITDTPQLIEGWVNKTVTQARSLYYDINCDLINPKNPSQVRNVGRLYGKVGIDPDGTYRYDNGNLVVDILPIGNGAQLSSRFGGTALGKPLSRPANWMDTLKCSTVNITRNINGKTTTIALKKYDKMDFRNHIIGAGPIVAYQPVTVNGEMLYDYDKNCWFFNNITLQYAENNLVKIDRLTGTIRWDKKTSEYAFDVRVNEPPPSSNAAFDTTSAGADEAAFFETDTTIPALVGTMKYKDTTKGDVTLNSLVTIDLAGHNITKQQVMALTKTILFSAVVPMNAD
jgi:hypothetical protein